MKTGIVNIYNIVRAIWILCGFFDTHILKQETAGATTVTGTTWATLHDGSAITKPTKLCGMKVTQGGTWAGVVQLRIVDGAGTTKIWPFQAQYVEGTDFIDATEMVFQWQVLVTVADGYIVQFRSSDNGDGAGETLTLDFLDIIECGI